MQEENFNLDYSNEFRDLHLNPAQFSQKLKRIGNNQIIWPPPRIFKEPFEIELPIQPLTEQIYDKVYAFTNEAKKKGLEHLREFIITLPVNVYSTFKTTGNFAVNSAINLYDFYKSWKNPEFAEEKPEKLEENWVFVLHSSNHNDYLEKLRQNNENPEILFTEQNIRMNNFQKNYSFLTENSDGKLEELWEFNNLRYKIDENEKEDTFSIMDKVEDYDDLDYAVPMRQEDIDKMFNEYIKCHLNKNKIEERKETNEFRSFTIEQYPVLLN